MISYDFYCGLLTKQLSGTATESEQASVANFEAAHAGKEFCGCGRKVWTICEPHRVTHDLTKCHGTQTGKNAAGAAPARRATTRRR